MPQTGMNAQLFKGSSTPAKENEGIELVERITTKEHVPGCDNYYEKNGLRTYGDGEGNLQPITLSQNIISSSLQTMIMSLL